MAYRRAHPSKGVIPYMRRGVDICLRTKYGREGLCEAFTTWYNQYHNPNCLFQGSLVSPIIHASRLRSNPLFNHNHTLCVNLKVCSFCWSGHELHPQMWWNFMRWALWQTNLNFADVEKVLDGSLWIVGGVLPCGVWSPTYERMVLGETCIFECSLLPIYPFWMLHE